MESSAGEPNSQGFVQALEQIEAAQESDAIERALTVARDRLHMDAAYVTTIDASHQTLEAVVGDSGALGLEPGMAIPLEQTYCVRMLAGEMPSVVPDTRAEPAVSGLAATAHIGAYVGVPVTLSDGRVHGTLCCASDRPCKNLGDEELRFMEVLAGIVAARVERVQGNFARLTRRADRHGGR